MRLFTLLSLGILAAASFGQTAFRAATKLTLGQSMHFTLEQNEQKDFSVQLSASNYFLQWDVRRLDEKPGNMIATVQFLKSTGVMVNSSLMTVNELHTVARVGKQFRPASAIAARLRVRNQEAPIEVWMTVMPAEKLTNSPFAWKDKEIKPLGIGPNDGKGGMLDRWEWQYHSIKLPAGKYSASLYFHNADGTSGNLIGQLELFDANGFRKESWTLHMNEIGVEARTEKTFVVTKPTTVLFRVTNNERPIDYTIGIATAD
jgi:hypothetical protein